MTSTILTISQIIVSLLLITSILLQKRGAAVGSAFGGDGAVYFKRRGAEKKLFIATIILSFLFLALSLSILILG